MVHRGTPTHHHYPSPLPIATTHHYYTLCVLLRHSFVYSYQVFYDLELSSHYVSQRFDYCNICQFHSDNRDYYYWRLSDQLVSLSNTQRCRPQMRSAADPKYAALPTPNTQHCRPQTCSAADPKWLSSVDFTNKIETFTCGL